MIAMFGEAQKVMAKVNSKLGGSSTMAGLYRWKSAVGTLVWIVLSSSLYVMPYLLTFLNFMASYLNHTSTSCLGISQRISKFLQ